MPPFEWDKQLGAFAKECSSCGTIYKGLPDQDGSIKEFRKYFPVDYEREDGFRSRCKPCMNKTYRRKRGVVDEYNVEDILKKQNYKCAICKQSVNMDPGKVTGNVDHDHRTGLVRGILCVNCNRGLGQFQDSTEILLSAVDYLLASIIKH